MRFSSLSHRSHQVEASTKPSHPPIAGLLIAYILHHDKPQDESLFTFGVDVITALWIGHCLGLPIPVVIIIIFIADPPISSIMEEQPSILFRSAIATTTT
jgi:hypothetical protein